MTIWIFMVLFIIGWVWYIIALILSSRGNLLDHSYVTVYFYSLIAFVVSIIIIISTIQYLLDDKRKREVVIFDRVTGTLKLVKLGLTVTRNTIVEVIELHGNYSAFDGGTIRSQYLYEVSVLVLGPPGKLERYPVLVCEREKTVRRTAQELARAFAVPHRKWVSTFLFDSWRQVPVTQTVRPNSSTALPHSKQPMPTRTSGRPKKVKPQR